MMKVLTPGIYFQPSQPSRRIDPQRTDIAGFVGLAERGPLHTPTRLTSWREYQTVFGRITSYATLALAVRGFFENGGQVCYVVRVADAERAQSASVTVPAIDGGAAYTVTTRDPGYWGNGVMVSVLPAHQAATESAFIPVTDDVLLPVEQVTGFHRGTRVRLVQRLADGTTVVQTHANGRPLQVEFVDAITRILTLSGPRDSQFTLEQQPHTTTISVESMEFTLLVWFEGQVVERFDRLAPQAEYAEQFAPAVVNDSIQASQYIRLAVAAGATDTLPDMPWEGMLAGGVNGLRQVSLEDFIGVEGEALPRGLRTLERIDEVSMLAMPDLINVPDTEDESLIPRISRDRPHCSLDQPVQTVTLPLTVQDAESGAPLANVRVRVVDQWQSVEAQTQPDGTVTFSRVTPGQIDVSAVLSGYEVYTERRVHDSTDPIMLTPVDLPVLSESDVYAGQQAIIAQCELLKDRVALLDAPIGRAGNPLGVEDMLAWRLRYATSYAAFYYPWLLVSDGTPAGRLVPPCGHVAGMIAAIDLRDGVARPPANRPLRAITGVSKAVNDALHGQFNEAGINILRPYPGRGIRVMGARTLSLDSHYRYLNVRRFVIMLREAIHNGLQWAVFETNGPLLWLSLRLVLTGLLEAQWRSGAFAGHSPEEAYSVLCDATNNPPETQENGQVIAEIGIAPVVPSEFIVLRLGLTRDEISISEA